MNVAGEKKHIENNKNILLFFSKENLVHVCTSIIPLVTSMNNNNSKVSVSILINNYIQESDTSGVSQKC